MLTGRRFELPVADAASVFLRLAPLLDLEDLVVAGDNLILDPVILDPYDIRPHLSTDELAARLVPYRGRGRRRALDGPTSSFGSGG